jgi:hypothetical protein
VGALQQIVSSESGGLMNVFNDYTSATARHRASEQIELYAEWLDSTAANTNGSPNPALVQNLYLVSVTQQTVVTTLLAEKAISLIT